MATIIRCDGGCGKESPIGSPPKYVANRWTKVILMSRKHNDFGDEYIYCEDCIVPIAQAMKVS